MQLEAHGFTHRFFIVVAADGRHVDTVETLPDAYAVQRKIPRSRVMEVWSGFAPVRCETFGVLPRDPYRGRLTVMHLGSPEMIAVRPAV